MIDMADRKTIDGNGRASDRQVRPGGKQEKSGFRRVKPLGEPPLEEIRERFRAVMQSTVNGIVLTDDQKNIISWNVGALRIFGYTQKEILGKPLSSLFPDQEEDSSLIKMEPSSSGKYRIIDKRTMELEGIRKNRTKFPLELSVSTWDTEKRTFHIAVIRDITERKKTEEKGRQAELELKQSVKQLQRTLEGTIEALAFTVGKRDPYTAGHQRRVSKLACAIAAEAGFSDDKIAGIRMASEIHDLGKMAVPAEILSKPGKLTEVEWLMIKAHPQVGFDILNTIDFPWPIAKIILQHHERLDGSGYPNSLSAEFILPEARIISIADVVEAMASHRPYRPSLGTEMALDEIKKNSGILYDPNMVKACLRLFKDRNFTLDESN